MHLNLNLNINIGLKEIACVSLFNSYFILSFENNYKA